MMINKIFLFPIQTKGLSFRFRLLKVSILPRTEGLFYEKILNQTQKKISSQIWKNNNQKCMEKWSFLAKIDNEPYIAIPADLAQTWPEIHFQRMNRTVSLTDNMKIYSFSFDKPEKEYHDLAIGWLQDNLRIIMEQYKSQLWNLGSVYFFRKPKNSEDIRREIDLFSGFSLKVYPRDNGYALCVSDRIKYVDTYSLEWYISHGIKIRSNLPRHGIYKNGSNWYEIQVLDKTGVSISNQTIPGTRKTVYTYIKENARGKKDIDLKKVNPNSPAFEYQYPNNPEIKHFANAAWGYFTFGTDDEKVKHLHRLSKMGPKKRLENVENFVQKFLNQNTILPIASECESISEKRFPIPPLVYGRDHKLKIGKNPNQNKSDKTRNQTIVEIKDWFKFKKRCLAEHGICKKGILFSQYLIVPDSVDHSIIDKFQKMLVKKIGDLTKTAYELVSVNTYSIPNGSHSLSRSFDAIEQTLTQQNLLDDKDATIVLVLPSGAHPKLHDHLKTLFKHGIRSQFLVESYPGNDGKLGLCDFFEPFKSQNWTSYRVKKNLENRFNSYVQNVALGVLMANRLWLFHLDKTLHHDLTIGIDISNRKVGMSLYDGIGGDLIFTFDFSGKTVKDDRYRLEKLPERIMEKMIYKLLNEGITKLSLQPSSIAIYRDGRSFDSEWSGLCKAISALQKEGLLDSNIEFGIIEIFKSSVSMPRIVSSINGSVKNPIIGTYEFINPREAILINTGFPAIIEGTAKPLLVRLGFGNINLKHALQDIFDLSNLCYAAPDKPQSLPLPLKILDDFLTPLAYDIEAPGYDEDDEDDETITEVIYPDRLVAIGERL